MMFDPVFNNIIFDLIIIVFAGLVFGSFASALTYRIPRSIPWAFKPQLAQSGTKTLRSACPSCNTNLGIKDLFPIFSWLIMAGKCRHCGAPISKIYPACEIVTLMACLGIYAAFGLSLFSIVCICLMPFLVALMMIDCKYMILPNQLVAIMACLGGIALGLRFFDAGFELPAMLNLSINYIGGALIFGGLAWGLGWIMQKLLRKDALGFGDVKFFAASGLWLGISSIGYFCIGAGGFGVLLAFAWKRATGNDVFPFGPALIVSFYTLLCLQGSHFI